MAPSLEAKPEIEITWFAAMTTYLGYAVLVMFGHLRDFFGKLTGTSRYFSGDRKPRPGYAPLLKDWENFYTRRLYHRIQDCWNRPIVGPPTAKDMVVVHRTSKDGQCTMSYDGEHRRCLNLGSYNYLGFADDWNVTCRQHVMSAFDDFNTSCCSSTSNSGTTVLHVELEEAVARYIDKPACIVFNMGYGTNAGSIASILGKGSLLVSDSLNHTSLVNGSRASGATIRVFKHDDMDSLENVLRNAVAEGQPRTHRPWKKIVVMIEGIYSMEGDIVRLPLILRITKKYKAYVYLDEAHSIGCLGKTGRGVCEYWGVPTSEIDVMMGTFTKSFGAMGGYIAGSKEFIDHMRRNVDGTIYANSMTPAVCKQVLAAFRVITGEDGTDIGARKLAAIRENGNFFRKGLKDIGCEVLGDEDSPIIPIMLYNPTKIAAFSRECFERGLAVVVVGFPATPLVTSRARFCISAGHKREDLEAALVQIKEVARILKIRYHTHTFG